MHNINSLNATFVTVALELMSRRMGIPIGCYQRRRDGDPIPNPIVHVSEDSPSDVNGKFSAKVSDID